MTKAESEYVWERMEAALVDRLIDQCVSDGAEESTARLCVHRILRFVAKIVVQPDAETLTSSDIKQLKVLARSMKKVSVSLDEASSSAMSILELTDPSHRLFRASVSKMSRHQLVAYLKDYSEAILNEIGEVKLSKGRPPSIHVALIARFVAIAWRKATGAWPALTKSPDDGAPGHELFVCIPTALERLPEPYSRSAKGITERGLYDAVRNYIRAQDE